MRRYALTGFSSSLFNKTALKFENCPKTEATAALRKIGFEMLKYYVSLDQA